MKGMLGKAENTNIRSIQKTHQVHRCAERDQSYVLSTDKRPLNLCAATRVVIGIAFITCEHLAGHHLQEVMDPTSTHIVQWNSTLTDLLSSMKLIVVAILCTQGCKVASLSLEDVCMLWHSERHRLCGDLIEHLVLLAYLAEGGFAVG